MKNYIKYGFSILEKYLLANKISFSDLILFNCDDNKEIAPGENKYALLVYPYLVSYNYEEAM